MKTIEMLKQEFVDHIATIDKSKMSVYELCSYADLLKKADELFKPRYAEMMTTWANSPLWGCCTSKKEDA